MKKFYKSDFDFILRLKDSEGQQVPFPECDWEIRFYTDSKTYWYTASCRGGVYVNCRREGNAIRFIFNDHRLGPGILRWEPHIELPDGAYPDGIQDLLDRQRLGIELVDGPGDCRPPAGVDIEVMLPAIYSSAYDLAVRNGYKGTLDEYTEYVNRFPEVVETADRRIPEMSEQITAMDTEFRREIVGLWDATAEMQAKLADLYSTETRNLLKRLGYEEDDIEEYIWAVSHLNLNITVEDLHRSVITFERWRDGEDTSADGSNCYVMPKWTEEMEAGKSTPMTLLNQLGSWLKYLPHLVTAKEPWFRTDREVIYTAGIHAQTNMAIEINGNSLKGIGSVTGHISRFRITKITTGSLRFIRKFKSDIPVDLSYAFKDAYNLLDLSNVDISNATSLDEFACRNPGSYLPTILPDTGIPNFHNGNSVSKIRAFFARSFRDTEFDFKGNQNYLREFFYHMWIGSSGTRVNNLPRIDNCDITMSEMTGWAPGFSSGASNPVDFIGYVTVSCGYVSRIRVPDLDYVSIRYLCGISSPIEEIGVWEIDCPRLRYLGYSDYSSAVLLNIGENLERYSTIPIKDIMPREGFAVEPFRRSIRTWREVPEASRPVYVALYPEHAAALSEDEIAGLASKGYTTTIID